MKHHKKRRSTSLRRMPLDYNKFRITPLWIAFYYYNPEDPHLFVPDLRYWGQPPSVFGPRRGFAPGLAINLGHPLGWWVMGGMLVVLGGVVLALFLWTHEFFLLFPGVCFLLIHLLVLGYVYLRILDR